MVFIEFKDYVYVILVDGMIFMYGIFVLLIGIVFSCLSIVICLLFLFVGGFFMNLRFL